MQLVCNKNENKLYIGLCVCLFVCLRGIASPIIRLENVCFYLKVEQLNVLVINMHDNS